MVATTISEVEIVQNPAIAATMIWQCARGYQDETDGRNMELHVAFFVLPICFHEVSLTNLLKTRRNSGLSSFVSKMAKKQEDLLAIHDRVLALRALTFTSIGFGVQSELFTIDYRQASLRANSHTLPKTLPRDIKSLIRGSERFGAWSGRLSIEEIVMTLRLGV